MGTPDWIDYNETTHGVNTSGYDDIFNRPNREIWANFTVEHQKDGSNKSFAGMWAIETGTYTGDGNDNRNITLSNANLDIKYLRIFCDNGALTRSNVSHFRTESMTGDNTTENQNPLFASDRVQSLGTGTFQVGTDDPVNFNTVDYYWIALGPD